ncbi:unnamed protein product [Caenorhabditis angaria]|uniref:glucuronosyltransferase n=1 Tax=Caenorhabditis angaria TaxID=860376 RepID=A0A9P1I6J4_9PELO|nr:unnamed protein product [Caenorhabditis angaria]
MSFSILLILLTNFVDGFNILVYSPSIGNSHQNFMGHLADTLFDAGHNVTLLVPIADEKQRNKLGIKTTKDVILVEHDEIGKQRIHLPDDSTAILWTTEFHAEDIDASFEHFNNLTVEACANFLRNKQVFEEIKSRNYDVVLVEPLSMCGLAFAHKLGLKRVILTISCTYFDYVSTWIGEPDEYSYVPALTSQSTDEMNIFERYNNLKMNLFLRRNMERMFDKEQIVYKSLLGEDVPSWKELMPAASMYFTNSNPFIDFPRPVIQKTVAIGGISVNMEHIRSQELSEEWNNVLGIRNKTMLISFGSVVLSRYMPIEYKSNLLKVIESFPDVTFIWKYELEDTAWAKHVSNIYFSKWVPQTALLNDNRLSAFLTHGGLGSTTELANCGKPALMVPIFGDQDRNANMLSRHGGAIVLKKTKLGNYNILRNAIETIIYDKTFSENAQKLANILENQPIKPKELVIKNTEFVAQFGPFPKMDPYSRKLNFIQRNTFANSHQNFMGHLADTLTDAGHNVTLLVPVADEGRRDKTSVKTTKDVVYVDQDEIARTNIVPVDDSMGVYWLEKFKPEDLTDSFLWFNNIMTETCANLFRNSAVFESMKSRNFDVLLLEPLSVCGLGFAHKLGIKNFILTTSCTQYDFILPHIGETIEHSYVPSTLGQFGDKMSFLERYENYKTALYMGMNLEKLFDEEEEIYQSGTGGEIPPWKQLLPSSSMYFTNSNPVIDFPRPTIQKTIPIGGISVDMEYIKSRKVPEEWENVLNLREKTMLISFGSMVKSKEMPKEWRDNLLKAVQLFPETTFIWKYESNDTKWADHVKNIHFSQWVPQTALLNDERITAFLTHGGLGSTNELAYCGKPALMIPIFGDQVRNAKMFIRHGGAIVLKKEDLSDYEIVKNSIRSILYDDTFKQNSKRLSKILENQPLKPKELVIKYTEFVAQYGPFPNMDPYSRQLNFIERNSLDVMFLYHTYSIIITFVFIILAKLLFSRFKLTMRVKKTI